MSPRRALLSLVAFAAVVLVVNVGIGRTGRSWDLTAEGSGTLSAQTLRVLDEVDERIEITAFFPRDAVGRVEAATLLSRYRKANRRITFRIVDPQLAPGEAQRLGVVDTGSAAVEPADDSNGAEVAQYTIELDVTSAIARLVRDVDATVCFTAGHGERDRGDDAPEGLTQAGALLRGNGYKVRTIDLLASPKTPRGCSALVVAAPASPYAKGVVRAMRSYLERSGKAFVLADPAVDVDLTSITRPWGIRFLRGVVVEGDADSHLPGDVTSPIVRRYSGASQVVRGLGPTFFPVALAVNARSTGDAGLTVSEIAATSRLGYLDRADLKSFDPKVDREGPVALGAEADDSEVLRPGTSRAEIRRTRVLAWGDVDFATNAYVGEAANARLFVQAIDWLTQSEDLVTAVPAFPKVRELQLTEARSRYLLLLTAGFVPGLFLIAGGFVWVLRRGR
jgi:gliding motility-associatede transport system auxiliary component